MQEAQLLNEEFINDHFFFNFYFFYMLMPMYPTNKSSSVIQNIETYTLKPYAIPHQSCANVHVLEQIKHVNSQLSKVSNKTPKILSSNHVFKILSSLMKSHHNFFRSTKLLRQHEHAFFFFFKTTTSVCKCVSHTPKLESYIVPNVCAKLKNKVKGIGVPE
jgi:hypothetical protein